MQQLSLAIDGMTCVHCAKRVEEALRRVAGVNRAYVNLSEKIATVDYDPQETDVTPIANAVREEGFSAGTAKTRMAVKGMRCASCVTQVENALMKTPGVVSTSTVAIKALHDLGLEW